MLNKGITFTACILILNLVGVGYGFWDSNINIINTVFVGNLDVQFDQNTDYNLVNGNGNLEVTFDNSPKTMLIGGNVDEKVTQIETETDDAKIISGEYSDYEGVLKFNIVNNGNIPAEIADVKINNVVGGAIEYNPKSTYIPARGSSASGDNEIKIKAGKGTVDFEIQMKISQPD